MNLENRATGAALVFIGRVLLLLGALGALGSALGLTRVFERSTVAAAPASYACPMHPEVKSPVPGTCPICRMALERVKEPSFEPASAAPPLVSPAGASGPTSASLSVQAENLLRYGIALARRHVFPQEIYAPAWLEGSGIATAILYKDEIAELAPSEQAEFFAANAPNRGVAVEWMLEPEQASDDSTSQARFRVTARNDESSSRNTQVGWLKLRHKKREALVVPASALLQSPEGPYLLVFLPERHALKKRPVSVGKTLDGFTAVVSGLGDRELVVGMGAFFMDAERRSHEELGGSR